MGKRATACTMAAIAGLALLAPAALAAPGTVTGGDADWGVKKSFRDYVTGPIAVGQITTSNGATKNGDGTFDFRPGSGSYDPAADAANVKFGGTVLFTGHGGVLRFRLTDPRVVYSGDMGTLFADVTSSEPFGPNAGQEKNYPNVDFASLDLTGIDPVDDGATATISDIPAKLTANGAAAFAGFYEAGEQLDPVTLSINYDAAAPPDPGPTPGVDAGTLIPGSGTQKVSEKNSEVALASVECLAESCNLAATPRRIAAEIIGGRSDGRKFTVAVVAPATVAQGDRVEVVAKFRKSAVKQLSGGGSAILTTELALSTPGDAVVDDVTVKVKGKRKKKRG